MGHDKRRDHSHVIFRHDVRRLWRQHGAKLDALETSLQGNLDAGWAVRVRADGDPLHGRGRDVDVRLDLVERQASVSGPGRP